MDAPTRTDILASNLLFVTVGLYLLYIIAGWILQGLGLSHSYFPRIHFNLLTVVGAGIFLVIRGTLYYGVRRGLLAAKLLVALGFIVSLYTTTYWHSGMVGGVSFSQFNVDSLVMLLTNLLTLAALGLMFWPGKQEADLI